MGDLEKQNMLSQLFERGVEKVYPGPEALRDKLFSGEKLRVYLGIDPTGPMQLHHAIPMRKLRHFQDLGHHVILLIGSFTAMIGDPTGKTKSRVPLTKEQVLENAKNYVELAKGILNFEENPPEIVYNGDWLEVLTFREVIQLAAHFTVQQMVERDMFQERIKNGMPISLHEFLYPLMQGYDSVALSCDVEVGGSDQTFNMLAGRKLVEQYLNKDKFVITVPLLTDENGRKTSTSDGTGVSLNLAPNDLYAKVMSLPDGFLKNLYYLCTDVSVVAIDEMMADISRGQNPMIYKKRLAHLLTKMFHGQTAANSAEEFFAKTVQGHELPEDIPEWLAQDQQLEARELLLRAGMVSSYAEAKRMIEEGAVGLYPRGVKEEQRVDSAKEVIGLEDGMIIRLGKRKYLRVKM
ncbi:MAG: tyrosine--tRNA ligase [Patescibacteria group bacterium]|nr:MAG: tyrosine--tRNA ligase [Patescibacteria group bacterium]